MIGAFVAATVVALVQYVRTRERLMIPLVALLALQAFALSREPGDLWKTLSQGAMCLAGLVLVLAVPARRPPSPKA